jgi:hypothetical protein
VMYRYESMTETVQWRENIATAFGFFRSREDLIMGTRDLDVDDNIYADNDLRTCRARTMVSLNSTRKLYNTIENFVNVISWTPFRLRR